MEIQWFARVTLLLDRTHLFIYIILVAKIFMTSLSPNIAQTATPQLTYLLGYSLKTLYILQDFFNTIA